MLFPKTSPARIAVMASLFAALPAYADDGDVKKTWTPEQQEIIDIASKGPIDIDTNFEGWEQGYHPEWSFWRVGDDSIRERSVHMALVGGVISEGNRVVDFKLTPVDVMVYGDAALLRYNAVETLENADGEQTQAIFSSAGFYVREDGVWRVRATNIFFPPSETE